MLTQTRPWPPPGAGGFVAASLVLAAAGDGLAADAEVRGLNKSPRLNLPGDGEAVGPARAGATDARVSGFGLPGLGDPGLMPLGVGPVGGLCFGSGGGGFSASETPAAFRQTS